MKPIGNAMTANLGDETDDGVCEHEEWDLTEIHNLNVHSQNNGQDKVCLKVQCDSCGTEGWIQANIAEYEVEWIE